MSGLQDRLKKVGYKEPDSPQSPLYDWKKISRDLILYLTTFFTIIFVFGYSLKNFDPVGRVNSYYIVMKVAFALAILASVVAFYLTRQKYLRQKAIHSKWAMHEAMHRNVTRTFLATPFVLLWLGLPLNALLDFSEPQTYKTVVQNKWKTRRGQGVLVVPDWHNPKRSVDVQADTHIYKNRTIGTPVKVTTKRGGLGIEWVVSVE